MAGVVPVVRVLEESLSATPIERIHGIVNGTTNFILTEMPRLELRRGARRGTARGYAEADPSRRRQAARDAAAKMAILARLAFGTPGPPRRRALRGHRAPPERRLEYARELGLGAEAVGTAERRPGGISVRVHPDVPLLRPPARVGLGPLQRGHRRVRGDHRDHDVRARRRRSQTASAVLGDVVSG